MFVNEDKEEFDKLMSKLLAAIHKEMVDDLVKKIIDVEPLEATEFMKKSLRDRYGQH